MKTPSHNLASPTARVGSENPVGTVSMGTVYLVGAGPGAPDLLTLRAARLIAQADIVFYDALVHVETIALATHAEKIAVGKRCGKHSTAQKFINKRLVDAARKHATVVRIKGGDPMLFGRAQEEIDALAAAGVPVQVVPGITAALAAAADLQVSLTRRGVARSVAFATPRVGEEMADSDWIAGLEHADTNAVYMGAQQAAEVAAQLIARGKPADTPVAIVESASLPTSQRWLTTLAGLRDTPVPAGAGPVLLLVGAVFADCAAQPLDASAETLTTPKRPIHGRFGDIPLKTPLPRAA
jgi:uroporphyrin-III C-methyltransferase